MWGWPDLYLNLSFLGNPLRWAALLLVIAFLAPNQPHAPTPGLTYVSILVYLLVLNT